MYIYVYVYICIYPTIMGHGPVPAINNALKVHPKPKTPNPGPVTRNPKPQTPNPKPETRNLKPETRNPKPESTGREPSTTPSKCSSSYAQTLKPETRNTEPDTRNMFLPGMLRFVPDRTGPFNFNRQDAVRCTWNPEPGFRNRPRLFQFQMVLEVEKDRR